MGKASSAKKVARAARAGGSRRAGQRRAMGFPFAVGAVVLLGLLLVLFARNERNANARPRVNTGAAGVSGDHWHEPYSIYVCVTDPSTPADQSATTTTVPASDTTTTTAPAGASGASTSSSQAGLGQPAGHLGATQTPTTAATTTTAPAATTTTVPASTDTTLPASTTSTTIAAPGDVPGEFLPPLQDAQQDVLGIHTHGDGVIHIHPFADSVSGRRATLDKFLAQVGASLTNDTLTMPTASGGQLVYKEGTTKCDGGKDGVLKVARWDTAAAAAKGEKPNDIITSNFGSIRLKNGEAISISFLPEGSTIPIQKDVETRLEQLTDIAPNTTTTNPQSQASGSDSGSSSSPSSDSSSSPATSTSTASTGSVPTEPSTSSSR
jgi:cytoskeletal protein RodZ